MRMSQLGRLYLLMCPCMLSRMHGAQISPRFDCLRREFSGKSPGSRLSGFAKKYFREGEAAKQRERRQNSGRGGVSLVSRRSGQGSHLDEDVGR